MIFNINNIDLDIGDITGLTSYQEPQYPKWYCQYVSESADIWNYAQESRINHR